MSPLRLFVVGAALLVVAAGLVTDYASRQQTDLALAEAHARVDALQLDLDHALGRRRDGLVVTGSSGTVRNPNDVALISDGIVERVKLDLRHEMGWLPARTLRARRASFVELYASDRARGNLRHGRVPRQRLLHHGQARGDGTWPATRWPRSARRVKLRIGERPAHRARRRRRRRAAEVDAGDWAIVKVEDPVDLPALNVNLGYDFDFADPIFRLGNDYSKGIILGDRLRRPATSNDLVTCLTDGHPGVSGGGVLDTEGRAGRHPDRPDAGGLPLLVHPAAARRDVPEGAAGRSARPTDSSLASGLSRGACFVDVLPARRAGA